MKTVLEKIATYSDAKTSFFYIIHNHSGLNSRSHDDWNIELLEWLGCKAVESIKKRRGIK